MLSIVQDDIQDGSSETLDVVPADLDALHAVIMYIDDQVGLKNVQHRRHVQAVSVF